MPFAKYPDDEAERLAALYELRLLDTPAEERFDRIARTAGRILEAPVAYVALLDGERQWFKATCGFEHSEIPRRPSMCSHTLLTTEGIICPDTLEHPLFSDNPFVLGEPNIRFYMGRPLATPEGYNVGTICVMDVRPRQVTEEQIAVFKDLASMAETEINLRDMLALQAELRSKKRDLQRRNEFISNVFGRFVSEQVAETLLSHPEGLKLGGERRNVTILMSDLRGFTPLSEKLPPEEMVKLINRYLAKMVPIIERHGGTIDEFIGDAILVLFNAPLPKADHAQHAVACALEMQLALMELSTELQSEGQPGLEMGIGVHTGDAVVGNIGSDRRMKYGVVGSAVNLTARIQALTLGRQILVSQATYRHVEPIARLDGHLRVKVKGIDQAISIYEVGGLAGDFGLALPVPESATL